MFTLFKCLFCSEQVSTTLGLGYSLWVGDQKDVTESPGGQKPRGHGLPLVSGRATPTG